jgi:hypothetical protein
MEQQDRRHSLRFPFDATAEFTEENSNSPVKARVTEISLKGCYLQTDCPLPSGAPMVVKIFTEGNFFEAHATVIYSKPEAGMGIVFRDAKPHFASVLKKWLLAAMLGKHSG